MLLVMPSSRYLLRSALVAFALLVLGATSAGAAADYWPGRDWRTAQPESQGVDSEALGAVLDQVTAQNLGVHSVLVIRHGYLVFTPISTPTTPPANMTLLP